jgi:hypothetical protein
LDEADDVIVGASGDYIGQRWQPTGLWLARVGSDRSDFPLKDPHLLISLSGKAVLGKFNPKDGTVGWLVGDGYWVVGVPHDCGCAKEDSKTTGTSRCAYCERTALAKELLKRGRELFAK